MIRLEKIVKWPRLKRPEGWAPQWGEQVWFLRGGPFPAEIVRVGFAAVGDRFPISVRAATSEARMLGHVPLSRLWPMKGWEQERARREAEEADPAEI
jgi:hypothetical protein